MLGIKSGRRDKVREALHDLFSNLKHIRGGKKSNKMFLTMLRDLLDQGLLLPDDALYDDPRETQNSQRPNMAVPKHIARAGLDKAGRVIVAPSI